MHVKFLVCSSCNQGAYFGIMSMEINFAGFETHLDFIRDMLLYLMKLIKLCLVPGVSVGSIMCERDRHFMVL